MQEFGPSRFEAWIKLFCSAVTNPLLAVRASEVWILDHLKELNI